MGGKSNKEPCENFAAGEANVLNADTELILR